MDLIIASSDRIKSTFVPALKTGLELSSGAKSTSTYYHTKDEQIKAIRAAVESLYKVDKALPILLATMKDCTEFFRQEVLRLELSSGFSNGQMGLVNQQIWLDERLQEKMIYTIVNNMQITYALRLFESFNEASINATRPRKIMLKYILANMNDFTVVKYGDKFIKILRHALGIERYSATIDNLVKYLNNEPHVFSELNREIFKNTTSGNEQIAKLILFCAGKGKAEWYSTMKFTKNYFDAADATTEDKFFEAAKNLDYTVVMGLLSTYKNPLFKSFFVDKKMKPEVKAKLLQGSTVITDDQKVRTKKLQEKTGGVGTSRTDINHSKVKTETLYKTEGTEAAKTQRVQEDKIALPYTKIGIIRDVSLSNAGGKDSANTPKVVIEHLAKVLSASCADSTVVDTPVNQSDFTKPFIEIVKQMPDVEAVFVLSDGYENYPYEGCLNEVVARYNKGGKAVQVIHCAPFVAAEMKAQSRELGSEIISMAVTTPAQIATQMEMRVLEFNPKKYFEDSFRKFLSGEQLIREVHAMEIML